MLDVVFSFTICNDMREKVLKRKVQNIERDDKVKALDFFKNERRSTSKNIDIFYIEIFNRNSMFKEVFST